MSSSRGNRLDKRPTGTTPAGLHANTGPLASSAWLVERELLPSEPRWFVEIALGGDGDGTSFRIELYPEEWGYVFTHAGRMSWIRVTDVPFVHGRDEHKLLHRTPPLKGIGKLIRAVEHEHGVALLRTPAAIRTNIADAERAIGAWLATL